MSEAIAQGLYHPNCRDVHTTYFGDEDEDFEYTPELQAADEERYKAEQDMRATANDLQQAKRFEVGSLLPENKAKASGKIERLADIWNTQATEAQKMGIIPPGFAAAGKAWESIKASVRSVYAPKRAGYVTTTSLNASSMSAIERRFGALQTSEVVMTKERFEHIRLRRIEDADVIKEHAARIIANPSLIVVDLKHPGTVLMLGKSGDGDVNYVVRLALASDKKGLKNSVITGHRINEKHLDRMIRKAKKNNAVILENML
jgi:hypothetical protein